MITDIEVAQRLLLMTVLAGAIGYERERHGRAAGFRTHIFVGLGSCLVMLTGFHLKEALAGSTSFDPTRMAAQVISGIGFLGAGTIIRFRASVRGLTTAASLWAVAGVGLAIGAGFFVGGILVSVIIVGALFGFAGLERAMRRDWYQTLIVDTKGSGKDIVDIRNILSDHDIEIRDIDMAEGSNAQSLKVELHVKLIGPQSRDEIIGQLMQLESVRGARWA